MVKHDHAATGRPKLMTIRIAAGFEISPARVAARATDNRKVRA